MMVSQQSISYGRPMSLQILVLTSGFPQTRSGEPKFPQWVLRIYDIGSRPLASQSTIDLPENQTRRTLFGEILAMSPSNSDLGYRIPSLRVAHCTWRSSNMDHQARKEIRLSLPFSHLGLLLKIQSSSMKI